MEKLPGARTRAAKRRAMTACILPTLPSELLLKICHFLLPSVNAHLTSEKIDLQRLRLTCKALNPVATEVFFESWPVLLWKRKDAFTPTKSLQLLKENLHFGCLVREIVLKTTWTSDSWFKCISQEEHLRGNPSLGESLAGSQRLWPVTGPINNISTVELVRIFSMLPNVQRVRLQRSSMEDEQFQNVLTAGFREPRPRALDDLFCKSKLYSDRLLQRWFPLDFHFAQALLETIPPKCKAVGIEFEIKSYPSNFDAPSFFEQYKHLRSQLNTLSLVIEDKNIEAAQDINCSPKWCGLINQFESLTQLHLHRAGPPLTKETARSTPGRDIIRCLVSGTHLPAVSHLTLSQHVLHVNDLQTLPLAFPGLTVLEVANTALKSPTDTPLADDENTWLNLAQNINFAYSAACTLSFSAGPFFELDGALDDIKLGYSDHPHKAITRALKPATQIILTAISSYRPSHAENAELRGHAHTGTITPSVPLREQYLALTAHTPPSVGVHWTRLDRTKVKTVETEGMECTYYKVVVVHRPVVAARGYDWGPCPAGVHPLDWH